MNDNFLVYYTIFSDLVRNKQGAAISCSSISSHVFVEKSSFNNCICTISGISPVRNRDVSGGACYFYSDTISMTSCYFYKCKSIALGSSVYACSERGHVSNFSCMSDLFCGQYTNYYHSIYALEKMTSHVRDLNSTKSKQRLQHGIIIFGEFPSMFTCNYVSLISSELNCFPLGISLKDSTVSTKLSHIYIAESSQSTGILTVWHGTYEFEDVVFYLCSGKLFNNKYNDAIIKLKKCVLSSSISIEEVSTENCEFKEKETLEVLEILKNRAITCKSL